MELSWCSQGGSSELGCRQVGRRVQGCSCHGLSAFAVCFLAKVEDVPNELNFETKQVSVCSLSSPASEKSLQVFEQVLIFLTCYEAHMQNYCFVFTLIIDPAPICVGFGVFLWVVRRVFEGVLGGFLCCCVLVWFCDSANSF